MTRNGNQRLSIDPIQECSGLNTYVFAANDPMNSVDISGLKEKKATWGEFLTRTEVLLDQGKDFAKEINDAIEKGKLTKVTHAQAFEALYGIGNLTSQMVDFLDAILRGS